jgi:membrane protease YdiL (CAAX protease family)
MEYTDLNSKIMIQKREASGQLTWKWPVLIVFARLFFAVIAQSLIALLFFSSAPSPSLAAGRWWPVYVILIDMGCFFLVTWRAGKECLRFRDLVNFDSHRFGRDILLGLVYILWFFPLAMIGILGFSLLIFGTPQPPSVYSPLPVWAAVYSLLVFPAVWGLMEQTTYQGYALPRLESLLRSRWFAIALVAFGWGIQHIALPFTFDVRFMLFRFLSFLPLAVVATLVYLRTRRLIPLIVAHWAVDMLGILTGIILPMIGK